MRSAISIHNLMNNKVIQQFSLLFSSTIIVNILSFLINFLIVRNLSVENYGLYRYATNYFILVVSLLFFGLPYSASRLLAIDKDSDSKRRIIGASLSFLIANTIGGAIITYIIYLLLVSFGVKVEPILLYVAPFIYVTLGQYLITYLCQGLNEISMLSSQQIMPQIMILVITIVQVYYIKTYTVTSALSVYIIAFTIILFFGFWRLNPSFRNIRRELIILYHENKKTGFPIYIGGLFGVTSMQIITLLVGGMVDMRKYGQFSLAISISSPLSLVASTLGTVLFKSNALNDELSKKVVMYTYMSCGIVTLIYIVVIQFFLVKIFGYSYATSINMSQILGVGSILMGIGDFYHRFLGAHGKGKMLRNGAIITGTVGIVSAVILMPMFDVWGVAISRVLSSIAYYMSMVIMYRTYKIKNNDKNEMMRVL